MGAKSYGSLVEVFRGDLWEAELVKGLLAAAGVEAMIKNENDIVLSPFYEGSRGQGAVVLVNKEEQVYAEKVVRERKA